MQNVPSTSVESIKHVHTYLLILSEHSTAKFFNIFKYICSFSLYLVSLYDFKNKSESHVVKIKKKIERERRFINLLF